MASTKEYLDFVLEQLSGLKHFDMLGQRRTFTCGVRSIDVKEKYIKPTRVFELEDGVGIYRNRRR